MRFVQVIWKVERRIKAAGPAFLVDVVELRPGLAYSMYPSANEVSNGYRMA